MFQRYAYLIVVSSFYRKNFTCQRNRIHGCRTTRRDGATHSGRNVTRLAQSIIFHFGALHGRLNRLRGVVRDAKLLFAHRENNWTIFGRYIAEVLSSSFSLFLFLFREFTRIWRNFLGNSGPRKIRLQLESFKRATLICWQMTNRKKSTMITLWNNWIDGRKIARVLKQYLMTLVIIYLTSAISKKKLLKGRIN